MNPILEFNSFSERTLFRVLVHIIYTYVHTYKLFALGSRRNRIEVVATPSIPGERREGVIEGRKLNKKIAFTQ